MIVKFAISDESKKLRVGFMKLISNSTFPQKFCIVTWYYEE